MVQYYDKFIVLSTIRSVKVAKEFLYTHLNEKFTILKQNFLLYVPFMFFEQKIRKLGKRYF